jgi:TnpA family transposase
LSRHAVLTPSQRDGLLDIPDTLSQAEIERYFTFTTEQKTIIKAKRGLHNRVGFAVQWAYLRYSGRRWEQNEQPPEAVLLHITKQIGGNSSDLPQYSLALAQYSLARGTTRREHFLEIVPLGGFRTYDATTQKELAKILLPVALSTDSGIKIIEELLGEMRSRQIIVPALSALESLAFEVRTKAQKLVIEKLTQNLTTEQKAKLDKLLTFDPEVNPTQILLTWLKQVSGKTASVTILRFLSRIDILKSIGIPDDIGRLVHQNRLQSLAREAARQTPQFLSRTPSERRYALLVAFVLETTARLTDQVLTMHDRMIQSMFRKGEIVQSEKITRNGRATNEALSLLIKTSKAVIEAREKQSDPFAAIESVVSWDSFTTRVAEADQITQRESFNALEHIDSHYKTIHRYAPTMLETFEFKGHSSMKSLLAALILLRRLNADEIRKVPSDAPTQFVKDRWKEYVFTDKTPPEGSNQASRLGNLRVAIDRHYYELCVLTSLRDALRSGDLFVQGSRQYRDFEEYLLPVNAVPEVLKAIPIEKDVDTYLSQRKEQLQEALSRVNRLLGEGKLEGVRVEKERIVITPLASSVPPEAEEHTDRAYDLLPSLAGASGHSVKITDLLVEVDRWTNFTSHFTTLRQGAPTKDKEALFAALLAEATNLGEMKIAEATRGMTYGRISGVIDNCFRDSTFTEALANLVNTQQEQELSALWGKGTTSSSDGQHFPVGGRRESVAQANARKGTGPKVAFYTHVSDRYAPFHIKAISAGDREATHVLDGLMYHESDIQIEEHYTDTNGYTEQVFAMCHLQGFRFAPRIRDIVSKNIYITGNPDDYPSLASLIGGTVQEKVIRENWSDVLRVAASIRQGSVTASLMLAKLAAYPKRNNIAWALQQIGQMERTLFTLNWLEDPRLRQRVTIGLNKGEQKHNLARAVCLYRRGMIQERSFEEMNHRASGLNLVVAAIVLWNTVYLQKAIVRLKEKNAPIPEQYLSHLSPMLWDHILLTGEYQWKL